METQRPARHSRRQQIQRIIIDTLRLRAIQAFIVLWLICALILLLNGHNPLGGLANLIAISIAGAITISVTQPNPHTLETDPAERRRLYIHVVVIALFILLTAHGGAVMHGLLPEESSIPVWTPLVNAIQRFSGQTFGNDNYLTNPVQYTVIPLVVLLLLGAKLPDLGFGRGHGVWRVSLIWCIIPALLIVYLIFTGATLTRVVQMLISNALNNGFFEEFLFRGALQTRLRRLMSPVWAVVITAVVFGAWHIGLNYASYGEPGGIVSALAGAVAFQGVLGLAFGLIFERSRNLIAPSLFHVLYNTAFSI